MRAHDWPQKLDDCIATASARAFAYGAFDCALFAADCVLAMTGVDYAAELRGYDSKIAAYRIVSAYGSLEAMITSLLNRKPIHPAHAKRGDVVLAEIELAPGEAGECIGICLGAHYAFPQAVGIVLLPSHIDRQPRAHLAWSIE